MVQFTNLFPDINQQNVSRTTVIRFTIVDDGYGVDVNTLSVNINGLSAIHAGLFVNNYRGSIYPSTGKYIVGIFPKSPNFLPYSSEIKINLMVKDSFFNDNNLNYSFYTDGYSPIQIEPIPVHTDGSRACIKNTPSFFPLKIGAQLAFDSGIGTQIEVEWEQASPYNHNDIIYYNIYFSSNRDDVFKSEPEFLVNDLSTTIGGFEPGDSVFVGVRAAEFKPNLFTLDNLIQAGNNMYFYPISSLSLDITTSSMSIPVESVEGFPEEGILQIGSELIKYSSILSNAFVVSIGGRGVDNTEINNHYSGDKVTMFKGSEDGNIRVITVTPTFQKPEYAITIGEMDGYVDDGYMEYRQEKQDSLTTDGKENDLSGEFPRIDFCGHWRNLSPANFMQGQCIGSYFGGAQVKLDSKGNRYLVKETNVQNHLLQREEMLLETTGEPFVLVRRMWTGASCPCVMLRQEHPDARCPICFGTGKVSGYQQIFNPRRADRRILVRVDSATDDLEIVDRGGLESVYEPNCWTLTYPMIKDRDVLVRFNTDGTEEFRYEILSVDRMRFLFGQTAAQKFKIKRMQKTDMIYQFPITRKYNVHPNVLSTLPSSSPGMPEHYHDFVVDSEITDYSKLKVATMESQGHNHIIINGIIYEALGHTHVLPTL